MHNNLTTTNNHMSEFFNFFPNHTIKKNISYIFVETCILDLNKYNVLYKLQIPIYFILLFIFSMICMLLLTMVIAAITLVERKILSLVQRRVGPNQTAFRGRLQFIADALKLLNKSIFVVRDANRVFFFLWPCLALIAAYLFWINAVWGPSLSIASTEYNILIIVVFSFFFSISILLVSFFSKNKYCVLAAVRSALLTATLELVWGLFVLLFIWHLNSFSFASVSFCQNYNYSLLFILAPASPFVILVFLLEAARIPFDLVEAESELVAGYSNELSGFFFALFYLGEYFHLFFASMFFSVLIFGF